MMAAMEENLRAGRACQTGKAFYGAQIFRNLGSRGIRPEQLALGTKPISNYRGAQLAAHVLGFMKEKDRRSVVALSVHRLCMNPRHDGESRQASEPYRLERVRAFAFASARQRLLEVVPPPPSFDPPSGIGRLRSPMPGEKTYEPSVFLPTTFAEREANPVVRALELFNAAGSSQGYMAIRGLELIVHPAEL